MQTYRIRTAIPVGTNQSIITCYHGNFKTQSRITETRENVNIQRATLSVEICTRMYAAEIAFSDDSIIYEIVY